MRRIRYAQFHSQVFVSGVNLGTDVRAEENSSRYSDCLIIGDSLGVYISLRPANRATKSEVFIPWTNVKAAEFSPEDPTPVGNKQAA